VPKWTASFPGSVSSSPAVVNGVVYVGVGVVNYTNSSLYALDAGTGALRWNAVQGGGGLAYDPTVVDGTIYVGTLLSHALYAYRASTGALRWSFQATGAMKDPVVLGRQLYVASSSGALYALNARTGAVLWQASLHNFASPRAVAVAYGMVFVGSDDTNLYAFDARTGTEVWHATTGSQVFSSAAVAGGIVYVGSHAGGVDAFDATTGALIWNGPPGELMDSSPAVAGGTVYVGSYASGAFYALDAQTGAQRWSFATGIKPGDAAMAGGVVCFASGGPTTYALDAATGAVLWQSPPAGDIEFHEPVVVNGVLYEGSNDGNLYAYSLPGG
jgi:outer membrane protein assembly factor BamB